MWEIVNVVLETEDTVEGRDSAESEVVLKVLNAGFEPYAVVPWQPGGMVMCFRRPIPPDRKEAAWTPPEGVAGYL